MSAICSSAKKGKINENPRQQIAEGLAENALAASVSKRAVIIQRGNDGDRGQEGGELLKDSRWIATLPALCMQYGVITLGANSDAWLLLNGSQRASELGFGANDVSGDCRP